MADSNLELSGKIKPFFHKLLFAKIILSKQQEKY